MGLGHKKGITFSPRPRITKKAKDNSLSIIESIAMPKQSNRERITENWNHWLSLRKNTNSDSYLKPNRKLIENEFKCNT